MHFHQRFSFFGASYLYGYSGTVSLAGIRDSVVGGSGNDVFLLIGIAFTSIGLLFKVSAVPFHAWTPRCISGRSNASDCLYGGSDQSCSFWCNVANFLHCFCQCILGLAPAYDGDCDYHNALWILVAIAQRDVKRMLAYSSIAHAGFFVNRSHCT